MGNAFIVRPFGVKNVVVGGCDQSIDFDEVEKDLIVPALKEAGITSRTTQEIMEQGNIREDMFRLLVMADLVVADVSIHNANVFYELGIRHGLRAQDTFLLRANIDTVPFDLATDRYLIYDWRQPAAMRTDLARALKATMSSKRVDSPVYQLLPGLKPPDASALYVLPPDFLEAVERARMGGFRGDLRILAYEAKDCEWAVEGLRAVGRAQLNLRADRGAKETFTWLLERRPEDVDANQKLATVYQRLAEHESDPRQQSEYLTRSTQAIQRVIDGQGTTRRDRAEAYLLQGRNIKSRWAQSFAGAGADAPVIALRSPSLSEAMERYAAGFQYDLNHVSLGVNAIGLLQIRIDLARALPEVWLDQFDSEDSARREFRECEARYQQLSAAVALSLQASRNALEKRWNPDPDEEFQAAINEAEYALFTGQRPRTVAQRYREALAGAPSYVLNGVRDQLAVFAKTQVRSEFVAAVNAVLDELCRAMLPETITSGSQHVRRVILFTGHGIDEEGRRAPGHFPRTAAAEQEARRLIAEAVAKERDSESDLILGIAGGRSGGDILFHEVCAELNIPTRMYLPLPKEAFSAAAVHPGGANWMDRFERIVDRVRPRVLSETEELPLWLQGRESDRREGTRYDIWKRHKLWMLFNALAINAQSLTLIALWDQGSPDGSGDTVDLVNHVRPRGFKVVRLEAERLKNL
jgi:hypothetical protein